MGYILAVIGAATIIVACLLRLGGMIATKAANPIDAAACGGFALIGMAILVLTGFTAGEVEGR